MTGKETLSKKVARGEASILFVFATFRCYQFDAGILSQVDRRLRALWHRNTRETSKLWPLTATAGVSAGHGIFAADLLVLQDHCFHTYDEEGKAEPELKEGVASYLAERAEGKR